MGSIQIIILQNAVAPEGYKIFWVIAALFIVIVFLGILFRIWKQNGRKDVKRSRFGRKKLTVMLEKDRKIRPKQLTLRVINNGRRVVDIEAPVLLFRKLWSKRKFALKKVNNQSIYPMLLDPGKTHVVNIELQKFHDHDRKLKRFYWAKIKIQDVDGKKFSSKYLTIRKSLFS